MIAASSSQPMVVEKPNTSSNPEATYATCLNSIQTGQNLKKAKLKSIDIIHGEPTITFTMEEINQYTMEEGTQGRCLVGWLAHRHILVRFDRYDDYVLAAAKTVQYLLYNGLQKRFRVFPWTIGFNPKEETSRAFDAIGFVYYYQLIQVKGKLGFIDYRQWVRRYFDLWILEKTPKREWERHIIGVPSIWNTTEPRFASFFDGVIVFVVNSGDLCCLCYDFTRKSWRESKIKGPPKKNDIKGIYSYVESLVPFGGDEVENVEQEVHNMFLKQFMDMVDKSNLAQRELQSKLTKFESMIMEQRAKHMKLQAIIMELQAKVDADQLQVTGLANTQLKENIDSQQEESYEKAEIVSQSCLQEQTQLLKFQKSIRDGLTYKTTQLIEGRVDLTQEIDLFGSDIYDLEIHLKKRLVEGFSFISSPLTKLTQKKIKFQWYEACEKSFQKLKKWLTTTPIFTLPKGTQGFVIKVHERNDPSYDLELVVIVVSLKIWYHYIYGVHVYVFTDHKSKANVVADALSRLSMGSISHVEEDKKE
ncbi:hypothetical protein H5410_001341 [Solanum commersonii]|uniref:Reverse transcriptase RNase H-like domain-containing protein n=1 Tax=Solanum commersonii TaxID=4109 RepID=A0A9J6AYR3_SOLCO|nr:hypothetical protein H5410_001341 [Solanum commersonii]